MNATETHLEKFSRFEQPGNQPAWVLPLRKAGLARFAALGFPTTSQEDWRFTNVAPIAKLPFKPVFDPPADPGALEALEGFPLMSLPAHRLVFINGHFSLGLSSIQAPPGVTVTNLASALKENHPVLEQHLARHARTEFEAFSALNTAFFQDGGFIHLPAGQALERPVHLVYVTVAKEPGTTTHPRNLILAEANSRATVLETYVRLHDSAYFTNAVTELVLGDSAVVEHCKFQDESLNAFHLAAIHAQLGRGANLAAHSIATGGRLSRNNIRMVLAGEGVECLLNGLYLTRRDQVADHHMVVEHVEPHCNSHEYFNGILDGKSKGIFHGRIYVHPAAQKTDAKQTNKNLLLSDDATVDTKPQLEIYADDVKCTHGATIGQLNEESIFYLRARGIGMETARRMLIHAFAGEIIERVRHPATRAELDKVVWDRLEANPHVAKHH